MGVRFPGIASTVIVNAAVVTTAETVLVTTPPLNLALDFQMVIILWSVELLTGVGTTTETFRLRRGTTTGGVQVNVAGTFGLGAGARWIFSGHYIDIPGAVAAQQYSLTYTGNGATGNATVEDVCMTAFGL